MRLPSLGGGISTRLLSPLRGLRRNFARIEEEGRTVKDPQNSNEKGAISHNDSPRADGFLFAAQADALSDKQGLAVTVAGKDYALFRVDGQVRCIMLRALTKARPLPKVR